MKQLYPPYLEGVIPAFYGTTIILPFEMNPAVSWSEITGFILKIKNIYTNDELGSLEIGIDETNKSDIQLNKILSFGNFDSISKKEKEEKEIEDWFKSEKVSKDQYENLKKDIENKYKDKILLLEGLSYKCQLAYYNEIVIDGKTQKNIGYYSTVATVKYTYKPTVQIGNLIENSNNNQIVSNLNKQQFIGEYTNIDVTEKVYSYCFNVFDQKNNLIFSTGEKLHNNEEGTLLLDDGKIFCKDSFLLQKDLDYYETYTIQYQIRTINNLEYKSPRYQIIRSATVDSEILTDLIAELNKKNGYIKLTLNPIKQPLISGKFLLLRATNKDNYSQWNTVAIYAFNLQATKDWSWRDFTIEHGVTYKYALCQYNTKKDELNNEIINIVSNRKESNEVTAEFDDIFIYDGQKQLKIEYNPKISSFKINQLETKSDTIGGQFPYFFKNGNVKYREFPVSGLISYLSDDEELFMPKKEIKLDEDKSNRNRVITGFKQLKLPTTDLISYNFDAEREFKMQVLEFLTNGKPKLFRSAAEGSFIVRLLNISLTPNEAIGRMLHTFNGTAYETDELNYDNLLKYGIYDTKIHNNQEMYHYSTIDLSKINFNNQTKISDNLLPVVANSIKVENVPVGTKLIINEKPFIIGSTWQYKPESNDLAINSLVVDMSNVQTSIGSKKKYSPQGLITYSYKIVKQNEFDKYEKIERADTIVEFSFLNNNHSYSDIISDSNIINQLQYMDLENEQYVKYQLLGFNFIIFEKQEIIKSGNDQQSIDNYEIKILNGNEDKENPSIISIDQSGYLFVDNLDKVAHLELGAGVKAIVSARRTKITYEEGYNPNEESST